MKALESGIDENVQDQIKEVADSVLRLQLPTLLHYIVRTEPERMVVYPDKELDQAEVK